MNIQGSSFIGMVTASSPIITEAHDDELPTQSASSSQQHASTNEHHDPWTDPSLDPWRQTRHERQTNEWRTSYRDSMRDAWNRCQPTHGNQSHEQPHVQTHEERVWAARSALGQIERQVHDVDPMIARRALERHDVRHDQESHRHGEVLNSDRDHVHRPNLSAQIPTATPSLIGLQAQWFRQNPEPLAAQVPRSRSPSGSQPRVPDLGTGARLMREIKGDITTAIFPSISSITS